MRRQGTLLLFLAMAPFASQAQQSAPPPSSATAVTLAEAIQRAQARDPAVIQAVGDIRTAGAGTRAAWGEFLPSVSAGAVGGRSFSAFQRTDPRTGQLVNADQTINSVSLNLSASLDLFTGFRRGADLRAARAQKDQAEAALAAAQWQTAVTTSQSFLNALQSTELVRARRARIHRAEEQFVIAVARLTTRSANIADSLQAVVEVSQARLDLLSEEARLAEAEANLGRAVGIEGRVRAVDDSSLAVHPLPLDTAALRQEAIERSPAVTRADATVRASQANLSVSRASYWPQISLAANTAYSGSDIDPLNPYRLFNQRNVGISVQVPLFNQFKREQDVVTRATALDAARAKAADARQQISADLTTLLAARETAIRRMEVAAISLEAARSRARVQLELYRLGTITIDQLGQAEDRLNQAEEAAVTARFDYLRAKAQLEALIGRAL